MRLIRNRHAAVAGMVVASAMLVFGLVGTAGGKQTVKVTPTTADAVGAVNYTTSTATVPGTTQTQDNGSYNVDIATATCGAGTAIAAVAAYSIPNSGAGTLDADELLLAGVKKVGNGYTAEGVSDIDNATTPYSFSVEVTCASTNLTKLLSAVKAKLKGKAKK